MVNDSLEYFLENYKHDGKYHLTDEQKNYLRDCVDGDNFVANYSAAGYGKSVCLEALKTYLGDKLVICATTGIANAILFNNKGGDGTMHRVFGLPTRMHNEADEKKVSPYCSGLFASSDLVKYVVIEECGMMNPDQLDLVLKRIQRFNKGNKNRNPRRIKLIIQGDYLQLLPVISDKEKEYLTTKYGSHLLFESEPYKRCNWSVHVFTQALRTDDSVLKECLNVLRYGQEERYEKCIKWLNKRHSWKTPQSLPVIAMTNNLVDKFNNEAVQMNTNPAFHYYAQVTGKYDFKDSPINESIVLKKGLPVLTLVNTDEYSNGSFGYVEDCIDNGVYVHFPATGVTAFVDVFEFEQKESYLAEKVGEDGTKKPYMAQKLLGRAIALPIKVAAARSVYRCQGSTIDVPTVVDLSYHGFDIDEGNDWGVNAAYVAISRFRSPELIHLKYPLKHDTVKGKTHVKCHRKAIEYLNKVLNS